MKNEFSLEEIDEILTNWQKRPEDYKAILKRRQLCLPEVTKIGDNSYISLYMFKDRRDIVYYVTLNIGDDEKLLGRFVEDCDFTRVKYKDGKILIYSEVQDLETGELNIQKIHSLYDIADDTFYSCTEREAIEMFDPTLDSSHLKNKDNYIYRSDREKINSNKIK